MAKQLTISFPLFDFEKAKYAMLLHDIQRLEDELKHKDYSIRTHKGNYTKLKNDKIRYNHRQQH